jgi:DMSO/TMAO reductase YedYZ molybdopterin-dependent catalytic subunit
VIVPGWEGAYSVKWLTGLSVSDRDHEGPFVQSGYRLPRRPVEPGAIVGAADTVAITELSVKSVITSPAGGTAVRPGAIRVAGFAWSGEAEVERVDVSVDNGRTWAPARLGTERASFAWRAFEHSWRAENPGSYVVISRATDRRGRVQPVVPEWNPGGYLWNAIDQLRVNVSPQ